MNKFITYAAAFATIASFTAVPFTKADDQAPPPGQSANKPHHDMLEQFADLNLTDDQKAKIRSILMNAKQQMQALRADTTLTEDQKKEKQRQIRQDTMTQVTAILTDEQKAKLKAAHPGESGPGKGHGAMSDLTYLNLTADQQSQLEKIKAGARTQLEAIKADTTLTEPQKKEKAKPIFEAAVQQFIAILTPDQQKLFKEHQQLSAAPPAPSK